MFLFDKLFRIWFPMMFEQSCFDVFVTFKATLRPVKNPLIFKIQRNSDVGVRLGSSMIHTV